MTDDDDPGLFDQLVDQTDEGPEEGAPAVDQDPAYRPLADAVTVP